MSIPKVAQLVSALMQYANSANPTKSSSMMDFILNNNEVLVALASKLLFQPNTAYEAGDFIISDSMQNGLWAKCTTAGTTDTTEPTWGTKADDTVNSNGCIFTMCALATSSDLREKVDKIDGKGLSTNDYSNDDKAKVDAIADLQGATASTAGAKGYAPAPAAGQQNCFLKGDGTWSEIGDTRIIKGVSFESANAVGTRILNAVNDTFTPATESSAGTDTMASFAPYATYETLEKLNSSTGKLEVVAYEGDMLFDQYLTAAKQGSDCSDICDAVMVNFPMGYISRYQDSTSKEVWGVAEKQVSGVIPSPMHVWGGAQHKVAIGKYTGGILNGKAVCLPNVNTYNSQHLNTYSTRFLADLGCYTMNYACMC